MHSQILFAKLDGNPYAHLIVVIKQMRRTW